MMFFIELIIAFIIAILMTVVFGMAIRRHRAGGMLALFFLIIFLATWAIGLWVRPFGPLIGDVSWLPYLIAGLFFALILTAVIPPSRYGTRRDLVERQEEQVNALVAFDVFFWVLMVFLAIAIIIAYV